MAGASQEELQARIEDGEAQLAALQALTLTQASAQAEWDAERARWDTERAQWFAQVADWDAERAQFVDAGELWARQRSEHVAAEAQWAADRAAAAQRVRELEAALADAAAAAVQHNQQLAAVIVELQTARGAAAAAASAGAVAEAEAAALKRTVAARDDELADALAALKASQAENAATAATAATAASQLQIQRAQWDATEAACRDTMEAHRVAVAAWEADKAEGEARERALAQSVSTMVEEHRRARVRDASLKRRLDDATARVRELEAQAAAAATAAAVRRPRSAAPRRRSSSATVLGASAVAAAAVAGKTAAAAAATASDPAGAVADGGKAAGSRYDGSGDGSGVSCEGDSPPPRGPSDTDDALAEDLRVSVSPSLSPFSAGSLSGVSSDDHHDQDRPEPSHSHLDAAPRQLVPARLSSAAAEPPQAPGSATGGTGRRRGSNSGSGLASVGGAPGALRHHAQGPVRAARAAGAGGASIASHPTAPSATAGPAAASAVLHPAIAPAAAPASSGAGSLQNFQSLLTVCGLGLQNLVHLLSALEAKAGGSGGGGAGESGPGPDSLWHSQALPRLAAGDADPAEVTAVVDLAFVEVAQLAHRVCVQLPRHARTQEQEQARAAALMARSPAPGQGGALRSGPRAEAGSAVDDPSPGALRGQLWTDDDSDGEHAEGKDDPMPLPSRAPFQGRTDRTEATAGLPARGHSGASVASETRGSVSPRRRFVRVENGIVFGGEGSAAGSSATGGSGRARGSDGEVWLLSPSPEGRSQGQLGQGHGHGQGGLTSSGPAALAHLRARVATLTEALQTAQSALEDREAQVCGLPMRPGAGSLAGPGERLQPSRITWRVVAFPHPVALAVSTELFHAYQLSEAQGGLHEACDIIASLQAEVSSGTSSRVLPPDAPCCTCHPCLNCACNTSPARLRRCKRPTPPWTARCAPWWTSCTPRCMGHLQLPPPPPLTWLCRRQRLTACVAPSSPPTPASRPWSARCTCTPGSAGVAAQGPPVSRLATAGRDRACAETPGACSPSAEGLGWAGLGQPQVAVVAGR
jgi:hypothetical protein